MTTTQQAPETPPGSTALGEEVIPASTQRKWLQQLAGGRPGDPSWARPALQHTNNERAMKDAIYAAKDG